MKKRSKKVAVVCCNGGSSPVEGIARDILPQDCAQILAQYPQGIYECAFGCLGGGSCLTACRVKAVRINSNNTAEIIREKCVGCGQCVKACPQSIITLVQAENTMTPRCSNTAAGPQARTQCSVSCIACGICVKFCPSDAISLVDNHAVINQNRCIACGMCAVKCPRGVIIDADGVFTVSAAI